MWIWKNRRDLGLIVLSALSIWSLTSAIILAFREKTAPASLCGALGLLLLAFLQLSRFKKVRGIGFEAELWEDKQREADELISKTKDLLSVLATATLTIAPRLGRWGGGYSRRELISLSDEVRQLLKNARVSMEAIHKVDSEVHRVITLEMLNNLVNDLTGKIGAARNAFVTKISNSRNSGEIDQAEVDRLAQIANEFLNEIANLNGSKAKLTVDQICESVGTYVNSPPPLPDHTFAPIISAAREDLMDVTAWKDRKEIRRPERFFQ